MIAPIVVLALALLAAPRAIEAEQTAKIPRIGVLAPAPPPRTHTEAFRQGLSDLGYVEGKSIVIEWRWSEEKRQRLGDLAADLVRLRIDVIVTGGTQAARAAKQATTTIPIVMATGEIPSARGWSQAWRGRVAMSRGCLPLRTG